MVALQRKKNGRTSKKEKCVHFKERKMGTI